MLTYDPDQIEALVNARVEAALTAQRESLRQEAFSVIHSAQQDRDASIHQAQNHAAHEIGQDVVLTLLEGAKQPQGATPLPYGAGRPRTGVRQRSQSSGVGPVDGGFADDDGDESVHDSSSGPESSSSSDSDVRGSKGRKPSSSSASVSIQGTVHGAWDVYSGNEDGVYKERT